MNWSGIQPWPLRWKAGAWLPEAKRYLAALLIAESFLYPKQEPVTQLNQLHVSLPYLLIKRRDAATHFIGEFIRRLTNRSFTSLIAVYAQRKISDLSKQSCGKKLTFHFVQQRDFGFKAQHALTKFPYRQKCLVIRRHTAQEIFKLVATHSCWPHNTHEHWVCGDVTRHLGFGLRRGCSVS
jgi:hypothetical protein